MKKIIIRNFIENNIIQETKHFLNEDWKFPTRLNWESSFKNDGYWGREMPQLKLEKINIIGGELDLINILEINSPEGDVIIECYYAKQIKNEKFYNNLSIKEKIERILIKKSGASDNRHTIYKISEINGNSKELWREFFHEINQKIKSYQGYDELWQDHNGYWHLPIDEDIYNYDNDYIYDEEDDLDGSGFCYWSKEEIFFMWAIDEWLTAHKIKK